MINDIIQTIESSIINEHTILKNSKLQQHTQAIENCMLTTRRNMFEIASRLLIIKNEKLYIDDGYNDVFEYALDILGYKKNMVYKLIMTAEKFIEQDTTEQGKRFISILSHDNVDYSISQLMELNTLEPDVVLELDENNVINPKMTTKEIRKAVKSYKNGDDLETTQEVEETTQEVEEPSQEVDETALLIVDTLENINKILKDERIIKESIKVSKFQDFRNFLNNINL